MSEKMKILLTNDDSVYAKGIKSLKEELESMADITIIAPSEQKSATGHSISFDVPLRMREISSKTWACDGFPADCTVMGIYHVFKEKAPDIVISGINKGGNVAQDIYYSGTVAASREAAFAGIPAISVSLTTELSNHQKIRHYNTAAKFIKKLIEKNVVDLIPKYTFLNINVPNIEEDQIKGIKLTTSGIRIYSKEVEKRIDYRGRDYYWIGGHVKGCKKFHGETDAEVLELDYISVTLLALHPSKEEDLLKLKNFLDSL